jgi:hypothetical protein
MAIAQNINFLRELVEDLTPQLGGNLDAENKNISDCAKLALGRDDVLRGRLSLEGPLNNMTDGPHIELFRDTHPDNPIMQIVGLTGAEQMLNFRLYYDGSDFRSGTGGDIGFQLRARQGSFDFRYSDAQTAGDIVTMTQLLSLNATGLRFEDDVKAIFGTDSDASIKWDTTTSRLQIIGSTEFTNTIEQDDNLKTYWGSGVDSSIHYNGTNMVINSMEVGTGFLQFLHQENAASNKVAEWCGNATTSPADNDQAYISYMLSDSTLLSTEFARITWIATDVTDATEDGAIAFSTITDGALAEALRINGSGLTIGSGSADVDYTLTFDGDSNDGIITWDEDNDRFQFSDDIVLPDNENLIFGTGADCSIDFDGSNWQFAGTGDLVVSGSNIYRRNTGGAAGIYCDRTDGTILGIVGGNAAGSFRVESTKKFEIQSQTRGNLETGSGTVNNTWMSMDMIAGGVSLPNDSQTLLFGTGDDASITYDGTNFVFNSMVVNNGFYSFLHDEDAVSAKVAAWGGNYRSGGTALNDDEAYMSFLLTDLSSNRDEFARMTWIATDVSTGSEDGAIAFSTIQAGSLTEAVRIAGADLVVVGSITNDAVSKIPGAFFWAEESGTLSSGVDGGLQFSWGNGGVGNQGPRMPAPGTVIGMSIQVDTDTATGGTGVVQMAINGSAQGSSYQITNPGSADGGSVVTFGTALAFVAGDRLAPITTTTPTGGTTTDIIISFWVVFD